MMPKFPATFHTVNGRKSLGAKTLLRSAMFDVLPRQPPLTQSITTNRRDENKIGYRDVNSTSKCNFHYLLRWLRL